MDSFEANKIFGAILGVVFVVFGMSLLAEGWFHSEAPERPGYAIVGMEAPSGGAAAAPTNEVLPVAEIMASADAEAGAAQFKKCQACHSGEKGGPNKVGPDLWDLVDRPIAAHEGFSYSAAMKEFAAQGSGKWDWDHLNHFLHGPKQYISGTAMGFAGIKNDKDRGDLLAYLRTLSDSPKPLPVAEAAAAPAPAEGGAPAAPGSEAPEAAPGATTDSGNDRQPQAPAAGVGATPATPSTPPGAASGNAAPAEGAPPAEPAPGAAPAPAN
jgi:cytochrome c